MAAASEIEKKRAAAAERQVEILAEINERLTRIEHLLTQPALPKGRTVQASTQE